MLLDLLSVLGGACQRLAFEFGVVGVLDVLVVRSLLVVDFASELVSDQRLGGCFVSSVCFDLVVQKTNCKEANGPQNAHIILAYNSRSRRFFSRRSSRLYSLTSGFGASWVCENLVAMASGLLSGESEFLKWFRLLVRAVSVLSLGVFLGKD